MNSPLTAKGSFLIIVNAFAYHGIYSFSRCGGSIPSGSIV
jgi:hypothetical protein